MEGVWHEKEAALELDFSQNVMLGYIHQYQEHCTVMKIYPVMQKIT